MLSIDGLNYMMKSPGLDIWPGAALALDVFGFNMMGDGLRP